MKGGCCGRLQVGGCWGEKPPESASVASDASVASGLGGRKVHGTVRSQKIEMDGNGMMGCSLKTDTYEKA